MFDEQAVDTRKNGCFSTYGCRLSRIVTIVGRNDDKFAS